MLHCHFTNIVDLEGRTTFRRFADKAFDVPKLQAVPLNRFNSVSTAQTEGLRM